MVVAHLAQRPLLTPENHSSNPVISNFNWNKYLQLDDFRFQTSQTGYQTYCDTSPYFWVLSDGTDLLWWTYQVTVEPWQPVGPGPRLACLPSDVPTQLAGWPGVRSTTGARLAVREGIHHRRLTVSRPGRWRRRRRLLLKLDQEHRSLLAVKFSSK